MPFTARPSWYGETVVVIGSGRSFTSGQAHQIAVAHFDNRCRVIAINDAVYPCWWADWLHACDFKWWKWHIQRVQHFEGVKTTLDTNVPGQWAQRLENTGKEGFDEDPENCRTGNNGGYQGIHAAIHAIGEDGRILLVGFDMKGDHFFGHHPDRVVADHGKIMLPLFATILPAARARKIEIINCSPGSVIECFPHAELADVLCHG